MFKSPSKIVPRFKRYALSLFSTSLYHRLYTGWAVITCQQERSVVLELINVSDRIRTTRFFIPLELWICIFICSNLVFVRSFTFQWPKRRPLQRSFRALSSPAVGPGFDETSLHSRRCMEIFNSAISKANFAVVVLVMAHLLLRSY